MKRLYSFKMARSITKDDLVTKTIEGKEVKVLEPVTSSVEEEYFIRKPSRQLLENGDLFFATKVSEAIKAGVLSVTLLQKRLLNDQGVLSEEQKKNYETLYKDLFTKQGIHRELLGKEQTEEIKKEASEVFNEIVDILTKIQSIESKIGTQVYQNTAENLAKNKTALWWTVFLSYKMDNGKEVEMFKGISFDEKVSQYDKINEDGDSFALQLLNKFYLVTSLWYLGKAETQEEFDILVRMHENQELIGAIKTITPESTEVKVEDK